MVIRNLSLALAKEINDTTLSLEGIQVSLNLLARIVIDERIALDFFLTDQGRAFETPNASCCP